MPPPPLTQVGPPVPPPPFSQKLGGKRPPFRRSSLACTRLTQAGIPFNHFMDVPYQLTSPPVFTPQWPGD